MSVPPKPARDPIPAGENPAGLDTPPPSRRPRWGLWTGSLLTYGVLVMFSVPVEAICVPLTLLGGPILSLVMGFSIASHYHAGSAVRGLAGLLYSAAYLALAWGLALAGCSGGFGR